jgi:MSHA pilin protein MshD
MCASARARQSGLSLIEVVVTIVVVGVGLAGLMALYNQVTRASVDPMIRKQALAIAASLLEEIQLKPFTYCDPDDANVFTATSSAGCTTAEAVGTEPPGGEGRYAAPRFDNVSDYHNFSMGSGMPDPDVKTVNGDIIAALAGYSASVTITEASADFAGVAANDALKIIVTVTHPASGVSIGLQGYRLRYAPNSP